MALLHDWLFARLLHFFRNNVIYNLIFFPITPLLPIKILSCLSLMKHIRESENMYSLKCFHFKDFASTKNFHCQ